MLECIRKLVEVDQDWVPQSADASLYIRPTFIGIEVGISAKVVLGLEHVHSLHTVKPASTGSVALFVRVNTEYFSPHP